MILEINPEKLSVIKDIFNLVVWSITIIGGMYGLYNFTKSINAASKDRKIKNFQNRVAQIDRVRSISMKKCLNDYKDRYSELLIEDGALIIKKDWALPNDELFGPTAINVKVVDNSEFNPGTIKFPVLKIFPDKNLKYSDLLIKHNETKKSFFNGEVYCTYNVKRNNNTINLEVFKSDYFSFVNSCKVLELLNETDQAHKRDNIDVLDFRNRHSGIGVNAITIFTNVDNGNHSCSYFALHQRTNQVIESPNSIHVVPAGTYSPMVAIEELSNENSTIDNFSFDLRNTIYREFLEEVWETKHMEELGSVRLLQENPKYYVLKYFTKVYFLGLGLEPYNTKTEVLYALVFDMSGFNDNEINAKIKTIEEDINEELEEKIFLEVKNLFKANFKIKDFTSFFEEESPSEEQNVFSEGKIRLERFSKGVLEQYYSDINTTAAAKEIFRKVYYVFDDIQK